MPTRSSASAANAARPTVSPEEAVAALAADYDPELVASTLRRLQRYQAESGRTCERCQERKPLSAFSRDSRDPVGLRRYCRECDARAYQARVSDPLRVAAALYNSEAP
jgi:hypothetical protein